MFGLFALQVALTHRWMRYFLGAEGFYPFGLGSSPSEKKAAAGAMRELEKIVRMHSVAHRQRAQNE